MRTFDARKVAHYEVANYVAYYQKDWPTLLRCTVGLMREAFGLPLWRAIQGAYLYARAEVAFAPFPNNDLAQAQDYARRFYGMVRQVHPFEQFDETEAARLDVKWWIVHRELFANAANGPLVDALADLWAYAYHTPRERILPAARTRADAILISDLWVRAGKDPNSAMLAEEESLMTQAYEQLRDAIAIRPSNVKHLEKSTLTFDV
jgi:hypothetical protein